MREIHPDIWPTFDNLLSATLGYLTLYSVFAHVEGDLIRYTSFYLPAGESPENDQVIAARRELIKNKSGVGAEDVFISPVPKEEVSRMYIKLGAEINRHLY